MSAAQEFGQSYADRSINSFSYLQVSSQLQASLNVEEKTSSLFQPDILLPVQYLSTTHRKDYLEPEKRLMLAVLENAIACFQNYVRASYPQGKAMFQEAEEWILDADTHWMFSFENICEVLDFDPTYLRGGLIEWKKRAMAGGSRGRVYPLARAAREKNADRERQYPIG